MSRTKQAKKDPTPVTQEDETVSEASNHDNDDVHEPVLFNGDIPGPTGNVPT